MPLTLNAYKRSDMANVLVLHDFEASPKVLKAWFEDILLFFEQKGAAPTKLDLGGPNGVKGKRYIKLKSAQKN